MQLQLCCGDGGHSKGRGARKKTKGEDLKGKKGVQEGCDKSRKEKGI